MFTAHSIGIGTIVVISDPELIRRTFTADPTVLHAGDRSPLRRILGPNSLLGIDEERHLSQRKLLLPPFHGQRMAGYEAIIEEEANREIDSWPEYTEFRTTEAMMRITLNVILRAVFGAEGENLHALRELMPPFVTLGSRLALLTFLHRDLGPRSPWGRFCADAPPVRPDRRRPDRPRAPRSRLLRDRAGRACAARPGLHEDGSPMSFAEIADELRLTLLAAGPRDDGHDAQLDGGPLAPPSRGARASRRRGRRGRQALREATIKEVQRVRPVIPFTGRFVMQPFELGGYVIPPGCTIGISMVLAHTDRGCSPSRGASGPIASWTRSPIPTTGCRSAGGSAAASARRSRTWRWTSSCAPLLGRLELLPTSPAANAGTTAGRPSPANGAGGRAPPGPGRRGDPAAGGRRGLTLRMADARLRPPAGGRRSRDGRVCRKARWSQWVGAPCYLGGLVGLL